MYDEIILCNHLSQITKPPTNYFEYGSTIVPERFSYINMYGGEISNIIKK